MLQPDQSAEPVWTRRNIRDEGMERGLRRWHRSDRIDLLASVGQVGDKRRMGVMAEVALRAAGTVRAWRIRRRSHMLAELRYIDFQAAAIRRRQGRLERQH
jgi:hypothetical protein